MMTNKSLKWKTVALSIVLTLCIGAILMNGASAQNKFDKASISCDFDTYQILEKGYLYCDVKNKQASSSNEDLSLIFDKTEGIQIEKIWIWSTYTEQNEVFQKQCDHSEYFKENETWNNYTYGCDPKNVSVAKEGWVEVKDSIAKTKENNDQKFKLQSQKIDASGTNKYKLKIKVPAKSEGKFNVFYGLDFLDPWWDADWMYKMVHYTNTTTLGINNLPIVVNGSVNYVDTASLIAAGKMKSDCSDIRFLNGDEDLELDYTFENATGTYGCNKAKTIIWLRVPSITKNTNLTSYMYYNNSAATAGNDSVGTWPNYIGVWHFSAESGMVFTDDSGNGNTIGPANSSTKLGNSNLTGVYGSAITFNGSGGLYMNDSAMLDAANITVSFWINGSDMTSTRWITGRYATASTSDRQWQVMNMDNSSLQFSGTGTDSGADCPFGAFSDNTWYFITLVMDANNKLAYVNGNLSRNCTGIGAAWAGLGASDSRFVIGCIANGAFPDQCGATGTANFLGSIDELRIANVSQSAEWIYREYSLSNMAVFGAETLGETGYVYLESPADNSWSIITNIAYTFTPNFTNAIQNCTLYANESGTWQAVKTNDTEMVNATSNNINYDIVSDANYTWNVECCSTTLCASGLANRTIMIDSVDPTFTIEGPTNTSTLPGSTSSIIINVSTPSENAWCQHKTTPFNWGASGTNFTSGEGTKLHNFTQAVTEGNNYTLYYNCRDVAGNNWDGENEVHEFYVTMKPAIDYVLPTPTANATVIDKLESIFINGTLDVDISDAGATACVLDWNSTSNATMNKTGSRPNYVCSYNKTSFEAYGWQKFRIIASNTAGDENVTSYKYINRVNSVRPVVVITNPLNGSSVHSENVTMNWTGTDADHDSLTYYFTIKPYGGVWESWNTTTDENVTLYGLNESRWDFMIYADDGYINSTNASSYFTYSVTPFIGSLIPEIRTEYFEPPKGSSFRADFSCMADLGNDSSLKYMEYGIVLNSSGYKYMLGNVTNTSGSDYCNWRGEICEEPGYGYITSWAMINPLSNTSSAAPYENQDWNNSLELYVSCVADDGTMNNMTKIVNMSGEAICDASDAYRSKECFNDLWGSAINAAWASGVVSYPFYGRFYADTQDFGVTPYVYYFMGNVSKYGEIISEYTTPDNYQCNKVFPEPVRSGTIVWDMINYFQYPGIISIGDNAGNNMISLVWINGKILADYGTATMGSGTDSMYWSSVVGFYDIGEEYTYKLDFDYDTGVNTLSAYRWHDGLRTLEWITENVQFRTLNSPVLGTEWFCVGLTSSLCNTDADCLQSYMKYPNGTYYINDTQSGTFFADDYWGDKYMNTTAWTYGWAGCVVDTLDDEALVNRTQWTRNIWAALNFTGTYEEPGWYTDNSTYTAGVCRNTIMIDNIAGGSYYVAPEEITPNESSDTQKPVRYISWLEKLGWKIPVTSDGESGYKSDYFDYSGCEDGNALCPLSKGLGGGLNLLQELVFGNFLIFLILICILMGIGAVYGVVFKKKTG